MIAYFGDYIADLVMDEFPLYAVDIVCEWGWSCVTVLEIDKDLPPISLGSFVFATR